MPHLATSVLIAVYFSSLALLSLFSAHRYLMLYFYYSRKPANRLVPPEPAELPRVTVQLPVYNEQCVVGRLLDSVAHIDYPRGLLQVQVLDDSTDASRETLREGVERLAAQGIDVQYIHRDNRDGFKAGALRNGMESATGEFIAIFDADFVIPPGFLRDAIPHFSDDSVGMVQLRWDHINRRYSMLTRLQSIMLDGHFVIEHAARHFSGRFFNFNGTAGVWRASAIAAAGGWQHDTLTEDLDLSYRAQLCGWKFVYLPASTAPAELPVEINAFKTQQHRWAKGSIQTAFKLLPAIWRSGQPLRVKIESTFHLANNLAYPLLFLVSVLMLPMLVLRQNQLADIPAWFELLLFVCATVSVLVFYAASQREVLPHWWRHLHLVPLMMSLGIGMCVNNSKAVMEAMLGVKSGFVRTPKFGVVNRTRGQLPNPYLTRAAGVALVETALALYYGVIIVYCLATGSFVTLPFMLLFFFGFSYVGILSMRTNLRLPSAACAVAVPQDA
jgi:cellulose synthase/poly-beta-1,6-N-acetylglucosamine synthase-like glycosyltransferase